jgi:type II secretory pathway component PulC
MTYASSNYGMNDSDTDGNGNAVADVQVVALFDPVSGRAVSPSGTGNLAAAPVTVGATATLIAAARAGRQTVTVTNEGTTAIRYSSNASMTSAQGALLPGVLGASVTLNFQGALYGITASGSQQVSVSELY